MKAEYYNIPSGTNFSPDILKQTKLQNTHEQNLKKEEHEYTIECKKLDQEHERETLKKNLGLIGRTFGCAENATKNITAVICLCLIIGASIISIIVYYHNQDISFVKSMWVNISPIITLSLGYLFGKK